MGHVVPITRICTSLHWLDLQTRIFQQKPVIRCAYKVPGPNIMMANIVCFKVCRIILYLLGPWLFTGLIRWGIVIHGFVNGHSRLVVGMHASNNNKAETVLDLFLSAIQKWGVPSRIQGDHGIENLQVAAYMEVLRGPDQGSYIWGW
jgi:hypothetical protein